MIIKSHIRGGYRAAADYLKSQGLNEKIRLVEISDLSAKDLDEAFYNMWVLASGTKCTKPLHHISINPMKDERLTDKQVLAIVERCEEKYGYKLFNHQRVIVEHIKDGRQHFHVVWNRVSLVSGRPVWPGEHWNKSKQVCREMEKELVLKRPTPHRTKRAMNQLIRSGRVKKSGGRYQLLTSPSKGIPFKPFAASNRPIKPILLPKPRPYSAPPNPSYPHPFRPFIAVKRSRRKHDENMPAQLPFFHRHEMTTAELIAWAWANGRVDILAQFGIFVSPDFFEPEL